jgi:aryl-alcohol dehydrogenase-like predicted oxidoreductase
MRTQQLGTLEVSVVGLGCNNFGRALDERGSAEVVHAALEAGVNFFDTSSNYGEGRSERYLGLALGSRRAEAVIITKFGMPVPGVPDSGGARPGYIRQAVERSLSELGTDYIDLYMLHRPDPATPIDDTLAELNRLVEAGTVREIGCSNFDADQLTEALEYTRQSKGRGFIANQIEYSLLHRNPESNGTKSLSAGSRVALLPYYPLANGLLTGKLHRGEKPKGRLSMDRYQDYLSERNFDVVDELRTFAEERELSMVQLAIGWLLAKPEVPSVTPGATRPEQVLANVAAADWQPTEDDLAVLDSITALEI